VRRGDLASTADRLDPTKPTRPIRLAPGASRRAEMRFRTMIVGWGLVVLLVGAAAACSSSDQTSTDAGTSTTTAAAGSTGPSGTNPGGAKTDSKVCTQVKGLQQLMLRARSTGAATMSAADKEKLVKDLRVDGNALTKDEPKLKMDVLVIVSTLSSELGGTTTGTGVPTTKAPGTTIPSGEYDKARDALAKYVKTNCK
jgi:hypothetical protein